MAAKLTWTAASKTGTTVSAYRPREAGVVLATLGSGSLTYTDDSATTGTAYDVIADFADGTSVTSAAVTYTAPAPATPPDILPMSHWKGQFDSIEATTWTTTNTQATSGDSWEHYNMAYAIDGYGSMFEATGDTFYLDRGLDALEAVQASAVVSSSTIGGFADSFLTWPAYTHPTNADGQYPLYEFFMWRHGFRLLRLLHDSTLDSTWKSRGTAIREFAEQNVWTKWYTRGVNSYIYRSVTHITSHAAFIGQQILAMSADATRLAQARTVIDNFDRLGVPGQGTGLHSMRGQLIDHPTVPTAYFFDDDWGVFSTPGSDVSHGAATVGYISEASDREDYWTQADLDRFGTLLTQVVLPGTTGGGGVKYLDGSVTTPPWTGWVADGWPKLGRHSVSVQQALEVHGVQSQPQYRALMAANAKRWGVLVPQGPVGTTVGTSATTSPVSTSVLAAVGDRVVLTASKNTTAVGGTFNVPTSTGGGALTWTSVVGPVNDRRSPVQAWISSKVTVGGNVTVTVSSTGGTQHYAVATPVAGTRDTAPTGVTQTGSSASGLPSLALTGLTVGSYVFAASADWSNKTGSTVGTGQTLMNVGGAAHRQTAWRTTATLTGTTQTMNLTAPTGQEFTALAFEILPA